MPHRSQMSESEPSLPGSPSSCSAEYTAHDYKRLVCALVDANSTQNGPHAHLRTLVDFTLGHLLLLTNFQKREIHIADLCVLPVNPKNPVSALVVRSTPNSYPLRYYACVRHRDVDLCPHAAVAMYLFSRFHMPDAYGQVELGESFFSDPMFSEITLLRGRNRYLAMLYLQQHKAQNDALKAAGFDAKDTNILRLLATLFDPTSNGEVCVQPGQTTLLKSNPSPEDLLFRVAGFEGKEDYHTGRDMHEPPAEVVRQIFPFISDAPVTPDAPGAESVQLRVRDVLRMLRRTLVQDMAEIKRRHPQNPLCAHPIFCQPAFTAYAARAGAQTQVNAVLPAPPPCNLRPSANLPLQELQQLRENHLALYKDIHGFIKQQTDLVQAHRRQMNQLQNAANGMAILLAARSTPVHLQYSLSSSARLLLHIHTSTLQQGLDNAQALLQRLNNQFSQSPGSPPESPPPLFPSDREKALRRRLLRQAITLYEMWDDFKSLEKLLKDHGISTTEWLKVHGSSERQFRHTRMKIIRFVEEEAARQKCSTEVVKHKLHSKMRNRQRPWTLDEVQRMLTLGRRVDLSDA